MSNETAAWQPWRVVQRLRIALLLLGLPAVFWTLRGAPPPAAWRYSASALTPRPWGGMGPRAHGLVVTLQLPPGPHYLGDTVTATVTVYNMSATPIMLAGPPDAPPCDASVFVTLRGGMAPFYTPRVPLPSCPGPLPAPLAAGQAAVARVGVALTASRQVDLVAQVMIEQTRWKNGNIESTSTVDMQPASWAVWTIDVLDRPGIGHD